MKIVLHQAWLEPNLNEMSDSYRGEYCTGAYFGFRSSKTIGIVLLPPEWDASPLQTSMLYDHCGSTFYNSRVEKISNNLNNSLVLPL